MRRPLEMKERDQQTQTSSIYTMELHEHLWIGVNVYRVAGGWIYSDYDIDTDRLYNSIFVPFNNEFQ